LPFQEKYSTTAPIKDHPISRKFGKKRMPHTRPLIWINAGETSGDLHGALLMDALKRQGPVQCTGMGGPAMRTSGLDTAARSEDLSVMGFTEVLGHLPRIWRLLKTIKKALTAKRPDVVVLIDAPDFNFRVARMAHALGIPAVYYISPKLWAWRESRVTFIKKHIREMISILPFERDFYARHGMDVNYVGHPLVDAVRTPERLALAPVPEQIGILPGSRTGEITSLLPLFGKAAAILASERPHLNFAVAQAPGVDRALLESLWPADVPVCIMAPEKRYELMRTSRAVMAASGTATLETALLKTPTVVAYRFSRLTHALGRLLVRVPYISLPNLILGREVFPELLQDRAEPQRIAAHVRSWLGETRERQDMLRELDTLTEALGPGGAADRAAAAVLRHAGQQPDTPL